MNEKIKDIFIDQQLVKKIQNKLPKLFQLAELESSRAGKIGMEVGSVREKIIVALLIYKFEEENVVTDIPITESEIDVMVFGNPISIKTITGTSLNGVKLIWTVDAQKALEFSENYNPICDMIFIQINWENGGGLSYFPLDVQREVLNALGRETYIKLPKQGTNPRGVEMSAIALQKLTQHKSTLKISINWSKDIVNFKPFERWTELWKED
jgi:hypothetical protein